MVVVGKLLHLYKWQFLIKIAIKGSGSYLVTTNNCNSTLCLNVRYIFLKKVHKVDRRRDSFLFEPANKSGRFRAT